MKKILQSRVSVGIRMTALAGVIVSAWSADAQLGSLDPEKMGRVGAVDERFQSYNVEMIEVTGGRFWKPYSKQSGTAVKAQSPNNQSSPTPAGMNPDLYQQRPPIDLTNPRLRKLATALSPAYVRVSGTWANTTYFQDSDNSTTTPPPGFNGVLTRKEWKGVIDFARAVDAQVVTSFATSPGTRDAQGIWTPDQARQVLGYTKSLGGSISATEFMNEPTYAAMGGAPKGYDAATYGRDTAVFRSFIKRAAPEILFAGPGSVGEGGSLPVPPGAGGMLHSEDLLKAAGPVFDVFSYHLYVAVSKRCAGIGAAGQTTAAAALSEEWLSRPDTIDAFYAGMRDKYDPAKPLWITETADAACGGNPWASTFLDTFRYLDQHARMAKRGVTVIMHNTLASSDYGLLDENTFAPRPNFWASLLWRKLMGTTVLEAGSSPAQPLHLYAQCLRDKPGGVAILAINTDRTGSHELTVPRRSERYTLSAKELQSTSVELNGSELELGANDDLPQLAGAPTKAGKLTFASASITFLAIPTANNDACR